MTTKPFQLWTKQSTAFAAHEAHQYHQDAMTRMVAFRGACSTPTQGVACMLNKEHEEQVAQNTRVLKTLFECVGKQGLPFRGHRDDYSATIITKVILLSW